MPLSADRREGLRHKVFHLPLSLRTACPYTRRPFLNGGDVVSRQPGMFWSESAIPFVHNKPASVKQALISVNDDSLPSACNSLAEKGYPYRTSSRRVRIKVNADRFSGQPEGF